MSQFPQIARALLSGEVICPFTNSEFFDQLQSETLKTKLNLWLKEIDLCLRSPESNQSFYAASVFDDNEMKAQSRAIFQDIMKNTRFHLSWLVHFMNLMHRDHAVTPGEQVRYSDLLNKLNNNTSLQGELGSISVCSKASTIQDQLDALLKQLEKDRMIIETNSKSRFYQFTGKVEVLQECLIFIQENEDIPIEEIEAPDEHQRTLL